MVKFAFSNWLNKNPFYFKSRKKRTKLPLRDPIYKKLYLLLMENAGMNLKRNQALKRCQLRVIYTLLYFTGLRLNEIRFFSYSDYQRLMVTGEMRIIHSKTNTTQNRALPKVGLEVLDSLKSEIEFIFKESECFYLGVSKRLTKQTYNSVNFVRFVNKDLCMSCRLSENLGNISSHSFRVGFITGLLRAKIPTHQVSSIIGHKSLSTTLMYSRSVLSPVELQDIFSLHFTS